MSMSDGGMPRVIASLRPNSEPRPWCIGGAARGQETWVVAARPASCAIDGPATLVHCAAVEPAERIDHVPPSTLGSTPLFAVSRLNELSRAGGKRHGDRRC